jgi:hypothetical protein
MMNDGQFQFFVIIIIAKSTSRYSDNICLAIAAVIRTTPLLFSEIKKNKKQWTMRYTESESNGIYNY